MSRTFTRRALLSALGAWPIARAAETAWPDRALSIVVPTGPGTGPDTIARRIAELASPALQQPVVIDNRPGASGAIATERVTQAAGGHSLLLGTSATMCINPLLAKDGAPDPGTLLLPLCMLTRGHPLLVVGPDFPAADLAQFAMRARSGPGQISYASAGVGSTSHLAGALLAKTTGTSLFHVPYSDEAKGLADVISGQVHSMITFAAAVAPHVKAGRLKAIAIAGPKRSPLLPSVRTSAEQGVPSFELSGWLGLFAQASLPAAHAARLERECLAAARAPAFAEWIATLGSEAVAMPSREFAAAVLSDRAMYASLLKAANVTGASRS